MENFAKYENKTSFFVWVATGIVVLFFISGFFVKKAQADTVLLTASVSGGVKVVVQWSVPELRVGATINVPGAEPGTNDDTDFFLTVRTSSDVDDVILFTMPTLKETGDDGTFSTEITLTGIIAGTYDIGFKGAAHLTRVLNDVVLLNGTNTLNFTQADNSALKGSVVLLGGDINGMALNPGTLGDDVVNSVDISQMISDLDGSDPTGNGIRANINQDDIVNSVDLSILIKNLDLEGDN